MALESAPGGLAAVEAFLTRAVDQARAAVSPTCLGVGAVCEFGRTNAEVVALTGSAGRLLSAALKRRLCEASPKTSGSDIDEAADFLMATLTGIKVAARAGMPRDKLMGIARRALRSLR